METFGDSGVVAVVFGVVVVGIGDFVDATAVVVASHIFFVCLVIQVLLLLFCDVVVVDLIFFQNFGFWQFCGNSFVGLFA